MSGGTPFSEVNEEFSIVLSETEDWDGDEVAHGESHYLPTTEQDTSEFKPNTNMFIRIDGLGTSRRPSTLRTSARKVGAGSKLKGRVQYPTATPQDIKNCCSWEVDLAPKFEVKDHASGEKRIARCSFVGRSFKQPKNISIPSQSMPDKNNAPRCKESLSHGISKDSNVRINTREDGSTVITSSHKQKDQEESKRLKGNIGWGNNFIRLNLKNNNSFGRVKGARKFTRKKAKWKTEPLRQVGDGSNYLSGWEQDKSYACYNCGQPGHFASACDRFQDMLHPSKDGYNLEISEPDEFVPIPLSPLSNWSTTDDLLQMLQSKFGHSQFRGNQLEVITRILQGKSCLNIMPTGMGKSLCYQLPAYFLSGPVVVISPLIALMQDQCDAAPLELNPSILWSGQTPKEALQTLDDLKRGKTRLIFISPERATNEHFLEAIKPWLPLELLVIDEAHCISEWGHSFRPSYYRLGKVVRTELPSKSILALTATATIETEKCIRNILDIADDGKFRFAGIHENMDLRVENIDHRFASFEKWNEIARKMRLTLIHSRRAIVYCSFRKDADSLAKALALLGIRAKSYHSGISSEDRKRTLSSFSSGSIKVVVATTAFGMGINISAVDTVIHTSMPRSLEEYVQQIGRAGRGGENARCVCYLNKSDFLTLRSLCSNPHIRRKSICSIVDAIFSNLEIGEYGTIDLGKISDGQIPEETVESILCYFENKHSGLLTYLGTVPLKARVSFYAKSPKEMEESIVASILEVCPKARQGVHHVRIADLCSKNGYSPAKNFQELAAMSQKSSIGFQPSKEKGACYRIEKTVSVKERQKLIDDVTEWMQEMNSAMIYKLDVAHKAFQAAALVESDQGTVIRSIIERYFSCSSNDFVHFLDETIMKYGLGSKVDVPVKRGGPETLIAAKAVLRRAKEHNLSITASEISNVLHGRLNGIDRKKGIDQIMSVFWGRLQDVDHRDVLSAAETAIDEE